MAITLKTNGDIMAHCDQRVAYSTCPVPGCKRGHRQMRRRREGRRGRGAGCIDEGEKASARWRGRGGGHMGAHTCLYARVCTSTRGSGLVGYQGNGCVGLIRESPAGGEASEALPWQPPGQGGVCICAALAPLWIVVVETVRVRACVQACV